MAQASCTKLGAAGRGRLVKAKGSQRNRDWHGAVERKKCLRDFMPPTYLMPGNNPPVAAGKCLSIEDTVHNAHYSFVALVSSEIGIII